MTVNERIKELRIAQGLTMEQFGERIGIKRASVSLIESGKNNPSDQTIMLICREFGYREEWLRDGIEPKQSPKLEEDELAEYIEDLLSTENPTYTLIKSILKTYIKLDDKSKQAINNTIDKLIAEMKKED
ncbi:MAG: helix-turn-helix transcriptional regulator [Lachnospiraceae bacterium]